MVQGVVVLFIYLFGGESKGTYTAASHTPHLGMMCSYNPADSAAIRLQIYLLRFSHICAFFRLGLEGGTIQQSFKSCLASLGYELNKSHKIFDIIYLGMFFID